jgi:hypothetical protein
MTALLGRSSSKPGAILELQNILMKEPDRLVFPAKNVHEHLRKNSRRNDYQTGNGVHGLRYSPNAEEVCRIARKW